MENDIKKLTKKMLLEESYKKKTLATGSIGIPAFEKEKQADPEYFFNQIFERVIKTLSNK